MGVMTIQEIDHNIVPIILDMQNIGIRIDKNYYHNLTKEFIAEADIVKDKIKDVYGYMINPDSPVQVCKMLMDMRIWKSPQSTNKENLSKFTKYPIVNLVGEYRKYMHLVDSFTNKLPYMADKHSRIHTQFLITRTATGRLASKEPNLQNQPSRGELGKKVRQGFIASSGCSLLSIDYSQIELRYGAHFYQDSVMLDVFRNDGDIHGMTAHGILRDLRLPITDDNMKKYRPPAKTVNFGIFYSMSNIGLYNTFIEIGLVDDKGNPIFSENQCQDFIDGFFRTYPGIKSGIASLHSAIRRNGYVDTILGRRRFIPEVYSAHERIREKGIREGGNHPIQGCLPSDTKILTKSGWISIGDYSSGDVWTGESWAYGMKLYMGRAERIKLHLSDGRTYNCDTRHKLLIDYGVWRRWCGMDEIVGKPLVRDDCTSWGRKLYSPLDWYWAGRLIGDGHLSSKGFMLSFGHQDYHDKDKFIEWYESIVAPGRTNSKKACNVEQDANNNYKVYSYTQNSKNMWKKYGIIEGWDAHTKRIPEIVYTLDYNRRLAFFEGYFGADGYTRKNNSSKKITNVNKPLLEDTLRLMQTLNLSGRISKPMMNNKGSVWYDLMIYSTKHDLIVESVEYTGIIEDMYTLSVQDVRHAYSSEGLISKNSAADHMKLAMIAVKPICDEFKKAGIYVHPLLQIHDELLFEVDNRYLKEVAIALSSVMETVYQISIPTPCDTECGDNWGRQEELILCI